MVLDMDVCLLVGPYRNLTTLTASVLMLHKDIISLNHMRSINDNNDMNFLKNYSDEKLEKYISFAKEIINTNYVNYGHGGTILKSHAFNGEIENYYNKNFPNGKNKAKVLIWKESHINTNIILNGSGFEILNDKVKFLLPIRNPMDCAISNRKGYLNYFNEPIPKNKNEILIRVLELHKQLIDNKVNYFFDFEADSNYFESLFNIEHDKNWCDNFENFWKIRKPYVHEESFKKVYFDKINELFDGEILDKFKEFS